MNTTFPKNIPLTGSDCFIYTLETHDRFGGTSGNTCRYIIDVEGAPDVNAFREKLSRHVVFRWLSTFYIDKKGFLKNPRWKNASEKTIEVSETESEDFIPEDVAARKFSKSNPPLFAFDFIRRQSNHTTVVYSWHHLLMDGYGAALSLRYLLTDIYPKKVSGDAFSPGFSTFLLAAKAKFFIQSSGSGKLTDVADVTRKSSVTQRLKIISFSEVETQKMEESAKRSGACFGASTYYLTCCARAVKTVLKSQGKAVKDDFWIPVPQDKRKKGALWPIVGNNLSFLFYRVSSTDLDSIKTSVAAFNSQMIHQIKKGIPEAYDYLIKYLRRIPTPLYYFWIKGPKGKSLSSFLFTVAAEHPKDLDQFEGFPIKNVISLPPNTYPPGLTFAFMKFKERLQVAVLYYDEVLSMRETELLEDHVRFELIYGEPKNE